MDDRKISGMNTAAWALWIIGAALIIGDLFLPESDDLGHLGVPPVAGAAALHVRLAICRLAALTRNLAARDRVSEGEGEVRDLVRR